MGQLLKPVSSANDAGYFRIGSVVLTIPPESIQINRPSNNEQITVLRSPSPYFKKTGHQRIDVVATWKAMVYESETGSDFSDWEALQRLVAYTKVAPFIEVENAHLRQFLMSEELAQDETKRMAFAIRSLRVETVPDLRDALQVTIYLSWFNYSPFTLNFGYEGPSKFGVSAPDSALFNAYIESWVDRNLGSDWKGLDPDIFRLRWHRFLCVQFQSDMVQLPGGGNADSQETRRRIEEPETSHTLTIPNPTIQASGASASVRERVEYWAKHYGVPVPVMLAVMGKESGGNQIDPRTGRVIRSPKGALGLFQLMPKTAEWLQVDPHDPDQNIQGGAKYLRYLYTGKAGAGRWDYTLAAYNWGEGNWIQHVAASRARGQDPVTTIPVAETRDYLAKILPKIDSTQQVASVAANNGEMRNLQDRQTFRPINQESGDSPVNKERDEKMQKLIEEWAAMGWQVDHTTEESLFVYSNQVIPLSTSIFVGDDDSVAVPMSISVVFENNLPQIPLSAEVYPTMQHIGAATAMTQVSFLSKGLREGEDGEPVHPQVTLLHDMMAKLESQYHDLRGKWRAISSTHRMFTAETNNRVLNLLGINDIMPQHLTSETVPEAADMVQVSLVATHHLNTYEQLDGFLVKDPSQEVMNLVSQVVAGPDWQSLDSKMQANLSTLGAFRNQLQQQDITPYANAMARGWRPEIVPLNFNPKTETDEEFKAVCWKVGEALKAQGERATTSVYWGYDSFSPNVKPIDVSAMQLGSRFCEVSTLTYNDFILAMSQNRDILSDHLKGDLNRVFLKAIKQGEAKNGPDSNPHLKLRDSVTQFNFETSPSWRADIMRLQADSQFREKFWSVQNSATPSRAVPGNQRHHCYPDLQLANLGEGPGKYFKNYAREIEQKMRDSAAKTGEVIASNVASILEAGGTATTAGRNLVFDANNSELLANYSNFMRDRIQPPPISMQRAFPTFRLFLIEEDNDGPFYALDDFYTYNSVNSIEIIRYKDKPDTAVIQLTNFTNILQHKFYNNTTLSKIERKNRELVERPTEEGRDAQGNPLPMTNDAVPDPTDTYYEDFAGINRHVDHLGKDEFLPLWYYALRSGSKIQIRLGYDNDPDRLFPVFNGIVTEIQEGDVMTLICQGYMVELSKPVMPGMQDLKSHSDFDFYSEKQGQADAIIREFIHGPYAKHFGSRKVFRGKASVLDSLTYNTFGGIKEAIKDAYADGENMTFLGYTVYGTAALATYLTSKRSRAGENVFISRFRLSNGSMSNADAVKKEIGERMAVRPWYVTAPTMFPWTNGTYKLPGGALHSPWKVMKDVSRLWPEYTLTVKNYGFPYQADATLVFADPNDYYISRQPLPNEGSVGNYNKRYDDLFRIWWDNRGKEQCRAILNELNRGARNFAQGYATEIMWRYQRERQYVQRWAAGQNFNRAGSTASDPTINSSLPIRLFEVQATGQQINAMIESVQNIDDFNSFLLDMDNTARFMRNSPGAVGQNDGTFLAGLKKGIFLGQGYVRNKLGQWMNLPALWDRVAGAMHDLHIEFMRFLQQAEQPGVAWLPGNLLQPVQKWHIVTNQHIVSNTISVNDDVYNAIHIGSGGNRNSDRVLKAHSALPDEETRILDATGDLISVENTDFGTNGWKLYAQSYLKEELGKMYQGDLTILGAPEIEPGDVIHLVDFTRNIFGPIEVDKVIHMLSQDSGMLTVIKPRALVLVNQATGAGVMQAISQFYFGGGLLGNYQGLKQAWTDMDDPAKTAATVVGSAGAVNFAGLAAGALRFSGVADKHIWKFIRKRTVSAASAAGLESNALSSAIRSASAGKTLSAAAKAKIAASLLTRTGASTAVVRTVGMVIPGLNWIMAGWSVYSAAHGAVMMALANQNQTPVFVVPLVHHNKPWVGGLARWSAMNMTYTWGDQWKLLVDQEWTTMVEGLKTASQDFVVNFSNRAKSGQP